MSEEKKIIIDEDWKSQVEAEKEAAKQQGEPPTAPAPTAPADEAGQATPGAESPGSPAGGDLPDDPEMPPASLEMLLTTLATEAMLCMGQMPHPVTGETQVRRNQAKYLIDTIEVLHDKTQGNLEPAETQAIEGLLHQLRMAFVATGQ